MWTSLTEGQEDHYDLKSEVGLRYDFYQCAMLLVYFYCAIGWPIAYSQKIKIVKVRLAPIQSMPIIEIKFCAKNL